MQGNAQDPFLTWSVFRSRPLIIVVRLLPTRIQTMPIFPLRQFSWGNILITDIRENTDGTLTVDAKCDGYSVTADSATLLRAAMAASSPEDLHARLSVK